MLMKGNPPHIPIDSRRVPSEDNMLLHASYDIGQKFLNKFFNNAAANLAPNGAIFFIYSNFAERCQLMSTTLSIFLS